MSRAKRPKQQTSQPRSLLVITMLHCKTRPAARFGRDKVSASPRGGARLCPRPDTLSPHCTGGGGGEGHCVLEHTAGPLCDKGGRVECRLPRIILTNKLDTNTCQNEVKHVGEQTKKNREAASMLFEIGCGCSITPILCVELHSTLGRRGSEHWSIKLPRDDRHNPE